MSRDPALASDTEAAPDPRLPRRINAWYRERSRPFPWREPGTSPWAILLIEVMAQQTQIDRAGAAWAQWIERWPSPAALAGASHSEVLRAWDRLGYPRRALALHAAAVAIVERHGGEVPADLDALLELPGIGPYTAAAVAAFAYGVRTPVVDTNVRRVLARTLLGIPGLAPHARRDLELMSSVLPRTAAAARTFNAASMELGALVCTARAPRCEICPVADLCGWRRAGYPESETPVRRGARFHGSDRQLRGRIMAALRAAESTAPPTHLVGLSDDPEQLERALRSLIADGLAVETAEGYRLP